MTYFESACYFPVLQKEVTPVQSTGYITHAQMEQYLSTHYWTSPDAASIAAMDYFVQNNLLNTHVIPIADNCDIFTVSDEDFITMCDQLPVAPFFMEDRIRLTSASLFPPNYDCFVVRHLNSLRADIHHHDFFEICYVWSGGCEQITGTQSFSMHSGDFIFIPPGVDHKVQITSEGTVLFNIMVRQQAFLTSSYSALSQSYPLSAFLRHCLLQKKQSSCLLIHTDNGTVLRRIIKHLTQECYVLPELFCNFAVDIFNQLIGFLLLNGEVETKYLQLPENLSLIALLHEIQQHYRTVTLKSLAEKFYFTEEHLSRLIKKATGKNFSALLRETRISQAKLLVTRTELSMEQIGEMVGYSDASSFTKAFKSCVGQSPAQYRKQN